ncbi:hypothetical protein D3C77_708800 [compost metagenome]
MVSLWNNNVNSTVWVAAENVVEMLIRIIEGVSNHNNMLGLTDPLRCLGPQLNVFVGQDRFQS